MKDVTTILSDIEQGDPSAADQLLPLVYDELRRLAAQKMAQEQPGQTIQPTALVHEAYLRLVDVEKVQHWDSRRHFFAAVAEAMRRILIERARSKKREKRGGKLKRVELGDVQVNDLPIDEILSFDEALEQLDQNDPRAASLVKLRRYCGLSVEESAERLGISGRTGHRDWDYARAFLYRCIGQNDDSASRR